MLTVANGDVTLHCQLSGAATPSAPTLLVANSLGTDLRIWDAVAARLDPAIRLIRYDKRGHGLSALTPAPYAMVDHIADLQAIRQTLTNGPVHLAGVSVGGMIALGAAGQAAPVSLSLMDTGYRIGTAEMWDTRIAALERDGIEALAEPILNRWFSAHYRSQQPGPVALYRAMLTRTPLEGYLGTCAALRDATLETVARALSCPTLCLVGSEDGATPPAVVQDLAAAITGARYQEIAGAGHLPMIERPDQVAVILNQQVLGTNG